MHDRLRSSHAAWRAWTARSFTRPGARSGTLAAFTLVVACGGSNPGSPTPSPSPSASAVQPGGPVAGAYTLEITPSASCPMSRSALSFPMTAAPAGASPHPGVQILLDPNGFRLEFEALSEDFAVRGGLGTNEEGTVADQGMRVHVRAIGEGPVQRAASGQGEVLAGTLAGYLALAAVDGFEGTLGTCSATDHAFTLRPR